MDRKGERTCGSSGAFRDKRCPGESQLGDKIFGVGFCDGCKVLDGHDGTWGEFGKLKRHGAPVVRAAFRGQAGFCERLNLSALPLALIDSQQEGPCDPELWPKVEGSDQVTDRIFILVESLAADIGDTMKQQRSCPWPLDTRNMLVKQSGEFAPAFESGGNTLRSMKGWKVFRPALKKLT